MSMYKHGALFPSGEGCSKGEGLLSPCDTRCSLSGRYTIDTHHTRLDQRFNTVAKADLGEDLRASAPGFGAGCPGSIGVLDSRGAGPQVVTRPMSSCSRVRLNSCAVTQGSCISCFQIRDVAVGANSRSGQALHPGGHSIPAEVLLQSLLQSLSTQRCDAGQPVHRRQTRHVVLARADEEPPVARLVGAMQRPRAKPVLTARFVPALPS